PRPPLRPGGPPRFPRRSSPRLPRSSRTPPRYVRRGFTVPQRGNQKRTSITRFEEDAMPQNSSVDTAKGKGNQAKGKAQRAAGKATGNEKLKAKGAANQAKGKVQEAKGKIKRSTG